MTMQFDPSRRTSKKRTDESARYQPPISENLHNRLLERAFREAKQHEILEARERLFEVIVSEQLLERFEEDLFDAQMSTELVNAIVDSAADMSHKDLARALSYPFDPRARQKLFSGIQSQLRAGILTPQAVLPYLAKIATGSKVSIGFHMSPTPIRPQEKKTAYGVETIWGFKGRESDHRDNDLSRAYYSRSFQTLFRRGVRNHMYIVRASDADENDGTWWRATSLSIVAEISVEKLDRAMRSLQQQFNDRAESEPVAAE
jgi:hypothetical protein